MATGARVLFRCAPSRTNGYPFYGVNRNAANVEAWARLQNEPVVLVDASLLVSALETKIGDSTQTGRQEIPDCGNARQRSRRRRNHECDWSARIRRLQVATRNGFVRFGSRADYDVVLAACRSEMATRAKPQRWRKSLRRRLDPRSAQREEREARQGATVACVSASGPGRRRQCAELSAIQSADSSQLTKTPVSAHSRAHRAGNGARFNGDCFASRKLSQHYRIGSACCWAALVLRAA